VPKKKVNKKFGLADPTRLEPLLKKDGLLQVIIETPKNCRNKYAFDPEQEIFALKKVLPAGMEFHTTSASCLGRWRTTATPLTYYC